MAEPRQHDPAQAGRITPATRTLSVGPVEVLEIGEGPQLLVLLHAAAQSLRAMAPLARRLARPDRRVLVPHLPIEVLQGDPIAAYAALARACLAEVPAERRILFGHSMGALAALVAVAGGAAPDGLVLYEPIVTSRLDPSDAEDRALRQWDSRIVAGMEASLAAGRPEAAVAGFIEAWNEVQWDSLPAPARTRLVADAAGLARLVRATTDFVLDGDATIAMPVLVLQGEASPPVTRRMSQRLAADLSQAVLRLLPDCGHMGPITRPDSVAAALEAMLQEAPAAPPDAARGAAPEGSAEGSAEGSPGRDGCGRPPAPAGPGQ